MPRYEQVSGTVFSLVAIAQLARVVLALPAQVGGVAIPVWLSLIAFAVTGGLAIWAFRSARGNT